MPADPDCGKGFGPDARLRDRREFERVFADPVRVADAFFTLLARPNGTACSRLGLAISRRHLRTAVARNRVKRIVRESFRHHRRELSGLDVVVLCRQDLGRMDNRTLSQSLARLWPRLARRCAAS